MIIKRIATLARKKALDFYLIFFFAFSSLAHAQATSPAIYGGHWSVSTLKDFIFVTLIGKLIAPATVIVISFIILMFFANSARYIFKSNSAEERNKAMVAIMWGVLIIFIMVSVWGIVRIVGNTLNLQMY